MTDSIRLIKFLRNADDGFGAAARRLELSEARLLIDKADVGYFREDPILTDTE